MKLHPVPPMLTQVVQSALLVCDRAEFFTSGHCRYCGGRLSGYDSRTKNFAVVTSDDGDRPVEIIIHRAYCRECGRIQLPEEPFYARTRVGSPVIDLCHTLASFGSCGHVSVLLDRMGVKVERGSVRSYCRYFIPRPQTIAAFGMHLPISIITLSSIAADLGDGQKAQSDDILAACQYPSRTRPSP